MLERSQRRTLEAVQASRMQASKNELKFRITNVIAGLSIQIFTRVSITNWYANASNYELECQNSAVTPGSHV